MKHQNLGQAAIAAGQIALAAGDLAIEYANSKKLAKLQAGFQRILDSDATKIDYVNDLIQRIQIAATTLAHSGRIQPGTTLFEQYLAQIVKDDMQYLGNCSVNIYQPAPQAYAARSNWIRIGSDGFVQPNDPSVAPPDVGVLWATGCQSAQNQANIEYIQALKGRSIGNGLWTGLRGKIQQITRSDIGTVDLLMRMGLGILIVSGLIMILKIQNTLIEEQVGLRYTKKTKRPKKKA